MPGPTTIQRLRTDVSTLNAKPKKKRLSKNTVKWESAERAAGGITQCLVSTHFDRSSYSAQ